MDARHRRRPSSDRFLTTFSFSPPSPSPVSDTDELSEDDIIFSSSSFSISTPQHHHSSKPYKSDNFGILAALPESGKIPARISVLNHKALASPPSSSSSLSASSSKAAKMMIPKPSTVAVVTSSRPILSAPVKVPIMAVREETRRRCKGSVFGYDNNDDVDYRDDDCDDDGEMLPPHEIVARKMARSPVLSCSVLEGAGRTLKGRDLRRVRNAVFRQTGFID